MNCVPLCVSVYNNAFGCLENLSRFQKIAFFKFLKSKEISNSFPTSKQSLNMQKSPTQQHKQSKKGDE